MSASPARRVAWRVVRRVDDGAYADRALRGEADRAGLTGRDRALARALAYGAVQRRRTLDHLAGRLAERAPERVDPPLLAALRLGLLQVVWLGGVPDHAAVSETVELAKEVAPRGAGFVNAVMRRAAREAAAMADALPERTPEEAALRHSHPDWVARLWWEALGPAGARELMARDNEPAENAVRAGGLLATREEARRALRAEGAEARPAPWPEEGLLLPPGFDAQGSAAFAAGLITPQSRASMLVARVLGPRPGERVLDLAAAPGAKTTHLAALMEGRGELVAVERDPARADDLIRNAERLGAPNVTVVVGDGREVELGGGFDRVLLDAPCSALGTLRSRPDARWRREPPDVAELSRLQSELLLAAADRLGPGGTLVYSTCTISPEENERRVEALVAERPDLAVDDLGAEWPELRHPRDPRLLLTLPHRDDTDGFFLARLRLPG